MNNFLGIDIGGTNTAFGVVSEDGEMLYSASIPTKDYTSIEALAEAVKKNLESETKESYVSIGIGAPSVNRVSGCIEYAPNLEWGDIVPLKEAKNISEMQQS